MGREEWGGRVGDTCGGDTVSLVPRSACDLESQKQPEENVWMINREREGGHPPIPLPSLYRDG